MRNMVSAMAAIAVTAMSMPAQAQGLAVRQLAVGERGKVAELSRDANAACGTNIAFSIDYSTYAGALDDDNNQSPWAYLANVTDALKSICRTDEGRQAVAAGIRSVIVSNGQSERESLDGGTFRYTVPYSGHSPQTVVSWLKDNL